MSSKSNKMTASSQETSDNEDVSKERKTRNYKTARLVVRNLPFTCNEEEVHKHFSEFGTVDEVTLLRRNGHLIGCGFIQFKKRFNATKALRETSGKPFLGRPIIVDWAVPKNKFHSVDCEKDTSSVKITTKYKRKDKIQIKTEPKKCTQDDSDKRTVFLKGVPFQATNEDLKKCVETLAGPVEYAVICFDQLSEHSKGTGFVQFKDEEVADKVLNNEIQLILFGKQLSSHKLLKKRDLINAESSKTGVKDKRNLYLIREGVILAGSFAAKGVSQRDMNKRLLLEQGKSKALRNLHKFISLTRLVIYNLPLRNFENKRLLALFKSHSPEGTVINEARVMRNLNKLDDKGIPVSKGYGYVSFEKHEDALAALRSINNNPKIFSDKKRPIVSFSIEDKRALLLKQKRQEKSHLKNPKKVVKDDDVDKANKSDSGSEVNKLKKDDKNSSGLNKMKSRTFELIKSSQESETKKTHKRHKSSASSEHSLMNNFVGVSSKQGKIVKLPSKQKLRNLAMLHKINLKKDLLKQKTLKNRLSRKQRRLKKIANSSM